MPIALNNGCLSATIARETNKITSPKNQIRTLPKLLITWNDFFNLLCRQLPVSQVGRQYLLADGFKLCEHPSPVVALETCCDSEDYLVVWVRVCALAGVNRVISRSIQLKE